MIDLQYSRVKEWHHYHLLVDGVVVAWGKWRKDKTDPQAAEFHNETFKRTKSVLLLTRDVFQQIKFDMKQCGCSKVVVADTRDNVDKTRLKYWYFMGFKFITTVESHIAAVMEV